VTAASDVASRSDVERSRALTAAAQVATNADDAVKRKIHKRAAVEAMGAQRLSALALGTVIRPEAVRIGNLFGVPLDRAGRLLPNLDIVDRVFQNSRNHLGDFGHRKNKGRSQSLEACA
jgi:nucleoid-associated protein YgaU